MEDEEVKLLIKRLKIAFLIILITIGPLLLLLISSSGKDTGKAVKRINKKESFYVLVFNNKTKNKKINKVIKDSNVSYEMINTDKASYYSEFLGRLGMNRNDIIEPTLIYIKNGKLYSSLVDIQDIKDIKTFIKGNENN